MVWHQRNILTSDILFFLVSVMTFVDSDRLYIAGSIVPFNMVKVMNGKLARPV
jgi:hypothetical protein